MILQSALPAIATCSLPPQAGARLCKALGPEFLPYLPVVMPPLLSAARLEPEMKVHDPELEEYEDDDDVEHIQLGDKVRCVMCHVFCVILVIKTLSDLHSQPRGR
jgi:hypothetical protein